MKISKKIQELTGMDMMQLLLGAGPLIGAIVILLGRW